MWIKTLRIDGYRHFSDQTIEFEERSTILAGANNSGKTSVIDLLRVVLRPDRNFGADDFGAAHRLTWSQQLIKAALAGEKSYFDFLGEEDIGDHSPSIDVRLRIDYGELDDIREFAEYLMDLDSESRSLYFKFQVTSTREAIVATYSGLYGEIKQVADRAKWKPNAEVPVRSTEFRLLQSVFDKALVESCRAITSFADASYENIVPLERSRFAKLFNFTSIKASRALDDTIEDRTGALNKRLVDVAKESGDWAEILADLPSLVLDAIEGTGIRKVTSDETLKSLNEVIESISKTNGASNTDLFVDFHLTEAHVIQLIARAMQTRYTGTGVALGEGSQGLGYSNLILLHLETESFIRGAASAENRFRVNVLVVEEPESHMHPQMQNAFIKHLFRLVDKVGQFQALVTTHSNEIVRTSSIEQLRVLNAKGGTCRIVDLRKFHESQITKKTTAEQRLFSFIYSINFSDVLFADKVVMYEGDTERMYLQALIEEREDLAGLRGQYISYVQVGGAFAHIYKPLIVDTLGMKTVIITDLDYEKASERSSVEELNPLRTTNATLNDLFHQKVDDQRADPNLEQLFTLARVESGLAHIQRQPLLAVAYQTRAEGYARTLEEAILATLLSAEVWDQRTRSEWKEFRESSGLLFSIPNTTDPISIRQIVASTANNKTDFMYSLILKKDYENGVPPYILSALKWLNS